YEKRVVFLSVGEETDRDVMLRKLIDIQYVRNDTLLGRGRFRVKGDVIEIQPAYSETAYRVSMFGDEVEQITHFDPLTGEVFAKLDTITVFPATQYVTSKPTIDRAYGEIKHELEEQVALFESQGRMLEAHRIRQRTEYDLEMMRELGFCNGIENYSRILDGRPAGSAPYTLIDYFPSDFVVFLDESHQTIPQIGGMYEGDRSRKQTLVEHGFRLPSALDNRPLRFDEFERKMRRCVFVSATPADFERERASQTVEQVVRPTGLIDPRLEVRPARTQVDDVLGEISLRVQRAERVLITTLTKRMAEDLTAFLAEHEVKVRYLHSDVENLERVEIIRDLRAGVFDVLVGINLLREGLDLPEVSLVAILDADKEGFLRSERSLIQTIGRAARHLNGTAILYADAVTESMRKAIDETNRRRARQMTFNRDNGIVPRGVRKDVRELIDGVIDTGGARSELKAAEAAADYAVMSEKQVAKEIKRLEKAMFDYAKNLEFEKAARTRDQLAVLREKVFGAGGAGNVTSLVPAERAA
ncbi:MAG TPA: excinuclease ABC subunit UvrB, partial [Burkholderiaceae bacterium]|nr:excinuclease ABC subunit UvrB [Burkholderiaceae bacterium]